MEIGKNMCLAICLNPKKKMEKDITKKIIKHAWESNPDGGGFAYIKDGEIVIEKGFMTAKKFIKAFFRARHQNQDSMFLAHLRWASKGVVNEENTHPFIINDGEFAMIHNGTIYNVDTEKDQSDTSAFAENILSKLPANFISEKVYDSLIEDYIGKSKVAMLLKNNTIRIYNGQLGHVEDGGNIWYSNDYYKLHVKRYTATTTTTVHKTCTYCNGMLIFQGEQNSGICNECVSACSDEYDGTSLFCYKCGRDLNLRHEMATGLCNICKYE